MEKTQPICQQALLEQIKELEWNCQAKECVQKCEEYISQFPNCKQVIPYYAHMYQFINYVEATNIAKKLFDEDKFFFQNTYIYAYLLKEFDIRGRDDIQTIYYTFQEYNGEKNIYFYLAQAVAAIQLNKLNENVFLLAEAIRTYEGNDKLVGRVYHHLLAATTDITHIYNSIEIQPNFDYNYIHLANIYRSGQQNELSLKAYTQALTINPINFHGYFELAQLYSFDDQYEAALLNYQLYFKLDQCIPALILRYFEWRLKVDHILRKTQTEKESINIINMIKKSFMFEFKNKSNKKIFFYYCYHQHLFADPCDQIEQMRDLLSFSHQHSINGYKYLTERQTFNNTQYLLKKEANQNIQSILLILSYNKHIKDEIQYQAEFLVWDLYID